MNAGLNLDALDRAPVLGPLVRRTRSARFLRMPLTGTIGGAEIERRGDEEGYGTFGGPG